LHRLVRDITGLVEHRDGEITRLRQIIKQLQRAQYGRRAERLDPDQLVLALEELDTDIAEIIDRRPGVCSLVETAKLNKVEPYTYLADVLQRMVDDHPANRLDELLPWNWKA